MRSKVIRVPNPVYQELKKRAAKKQQLQQRKITIGEILFDIIKEVSSK